MTKCNGCGADTSGVACEFCGAIQRPPSGLQDELAALEALTKAAQHITTESEGDGEVIGNFWRQAWLPTHPDALTQAASMALAGVQTGGDQQGHGETRMNRALMERANGAFRALELRAPTDSRVTVLRRQVEETRMKLDAGIAESNASERNWGIGLTVFLLLFFGGLALSIYLEK